MGRRIGGSGVCSGSATTTAISTTIPATTALCAHLLHFGLLIGREDGHDRRVTLGAVRDRLANLLHLRLLGIGQSQSGGHLLHALLTALFPLFRSSSSAITTIRLGCLPP